MHDSLISVHKQRNTCDIYRECQLREFKHLNCMATMIFTNDESGAKKTSIAVDSNIYNFFFTESKIKSSANL